ncbi:MAG: hypothetical protein A2219_00850 [Elusimicrobia bacterium RIFOXYA2_FULL_50_26]|nr:MAG: hypothetical protein A2219_00850 [Elusimicrobia bacterium RIFOXYA2_FULL_50_26]
MNGVLRRTMWFIIPAAVAAIVFANSLKGTFFWDDHALIFDNPLIKTWSGTMAMFSPDYWKFRHSGMSGQYRPLRNITFTLDYSFWHVNPVGYHLTNMGLHVLNVALVAFAARAVFRSDGAALISGLLFAVHPVHIESINYVKNRSDLLCTLFFLSAFLFWLKGRQWHALCCYVLSIVSKELGVMLPFVMTAYALWLQNEAGRRELMKKTVPYFAVFGAFIFWKFVVLAVPAGAAPVEIDPVISGVEPLRLVVSTVRAYIVLLFVPMNLNVDRLLPVLLSLVEARAVAFYFICAAGLYGIYRSAGRNKYLFALAWIIVCLGPVSNIIPIKGRAFAEQRLYLPSVGWALFFGSLLSDVISGRMVLPRVSADNARKGGILLVALWVAVWSVIVIRRNVLWQDTEKLWAAAAAENPANSRAWLNLSGVYMERGQYDKAENIYRTLAKYPQSKTTDTIHLNRGIIAQAGGDYAGALAFFKQACSINPRNFEAWSNAGSMQLMMGDEKEAQVSFEKAIELEPGVKSAGTHVNIGVLHLKRKNFKQAEQHFRRAIELNPDLLEARANLATIYNSFGMKYEAGEQEREIRLRSKTGSKINAYNPLLNVR